MNTVNDESYVGEKFHGFALGMFSFIKLVQVYKISRKTFTVCWKSAKTTKLFSCITFIAYGINNNNGMKPKGLS